MRLFAVLLTLLIPVQALAVSEAFDWDIRGVQPKMCGMDGNRDGVYGQAADCLFCNGTETDPDGDGQVENQIYVDCGAGGDDDSGCGAPGDPCKSLNNAISGNAGSFGPGEKVICFTGSCGSEPANLNLPSGTTGHYTRAAVGNEVRSFEYPDNPFMILGWDTDGDGDYPPHDPQDFSEWDGTGIGRGWIVNNDGGYVELAHFEAKNFGDLSSGSNSANIGFGAMYEGCDHCYVHDLNLSNIGRDKIKCSNNQIINTLVGSNVFVYVDISNVQCLDCGGYFVRGGIGKQANENGPIRMSHNYRSSHGCDMNDCGGLTGCSTSRQSMTSTEWMKYWAGITGIELINNKEDGNLAAWNPEADANMFFLVVNCAVQDVDVIANEIIDIRIPLNIQSNSAGGACDGGVNTERRINYVNWDRNIVRYTSAASELEGSAIFGVENQGQNTRDWETIEDFLYTNNIMTSEVPIRGPQFSIGWDGNCGGGHGGSMVIEGNTHWFERTGNSYGAFSIGDPGGPEWDCRIEDITFNNNIAGGSDPAQASRKNVTFQYPVTLTNDYNAFSPTGDYFYGGSSMEDLSDWQSATGGDANGRSCTPTFLSPTDLHLDGGDSCAQNFGLTTETVDVDGQGRSAPHEIGADDTTGGAPPTTVPVCGNGILQSGEDCDDGNTNSGDCCSPTCGFDAPATSCDDGLFCNGADTCDGAGTCDSAGDPCLITEVCNEETNNCDAAPAPVCGNSILEDGEDCDVGTPVIDDCCDGSCQFEPATTSCDDMVYCNGTDECDATGGCTAHTGDPCQPAEVCNETFNTCDAPPDLTVICDYAGTNTGPTSGASGYEYRNLCIGNPAGAGADEIRVTIEGGAGGSGCEVTIMTLQTSGCTEGDDACGIFSDTPVEITFGGTRGGTAAAGAQLVSDWIPFDYAGEDLWIHANLGLRDCWEIDDNQVRLWTSFTNGQPGNDEFTLDPIGTSGFTSTSDTIVLRSVEVRSTAAPTVCGDSVVEGDEECDPPDASPNGCCTAGCMFESDLSTCDDTVFCNGADTCNAMGVCANHAGDPCSGGTPVCDEPGEQCLANTTGFIRLGR